MGTGVVGALANVDFIGFLTFECRTQMYRNKKTIALVPAYNEEDKIGAVVSRTDLNLVDKLLVIDDGSTDATANVARNHGAEVLSMNRVCGVGAALRAGIHYGREHGYDIAIIMAGNNKDEPKEIPRLLNPICDEQADLVMGSRFLPGGAYGGDMPLYRRIATKLHPWLLSLFVGKRLTESTNGFRAVRLSIFDNPKINLQQRWLDAYGLEVYMLMRSIQLGYRHVEVPCTKIYPSRHKGNTKMRPVIDWWNILQPIFLIGLGIRK